MEVGEAMEVDERGKGESGGGGLERCAMELEEKAEKEEELEEVKKAEKVRRRWRRHV